MIDHFEIKVAAFEECRVFYMNALEPLGIELKWSDENAAGFGLSNEPNVRFLIEKGVSNSTCHIAFSALDKRQVTAFHEGVCLLEANVTGNLVYEVTTLQITTQLF